MGEDVDDDAFAWNRDPDHRCCGDHFQQQGLVLRRRAFYNLFFQGCYANCLDNPEQLR